VSAVEDRRRLTWVARGLLALLSLVAITFYVVASTVSGVGAPARPFNGWIAVLSHVGEESHQVRISVSATTPGGLGARPGVRITVTVCGPSAYHGVLLTGGNARLLDIRQAIPGPTGFEMRRVHPAQLSGRIGDLSSGDVVGVGWTDAIRLAVPRVTECLPQKAGVAPAELGTSITFVGQFSEAVQLRPSILGFHGPRQSETWPLIGRIPGVPSTSLGSFLVDGLQGQWARPIRLDVRVDVGSLGLRAAVEASRPQLVDSESLRWEAETPIQPFARLVDLHDQETWQHVTVAAGIALGVAASLLAALLLELIGPVRQRDRHCPANGSNGDAARVQESQRIADQSQSRRSGSALVALAVAYLVVRARRRRGRGS
jgi:hypothetical protein